MALHPGRFNSSTSKLFGGHTNIHRQVHPPSRLFFVQKPVRISYFIPSQTHTHLPQRNITGALMVLPSGLSHNLSEILFTLLSASQSSVEQKLTAQFLFPYLFGLHHICFPSPYCLFPFGTPSYRFPSVYMLPFSMCHTWQFRTKFTSLISWRPVSTTARLCTVHCSRLIQSSLSNLISLTRILKYPSLLRAGTKCYLRYGFQSKFCAYFSSVLCPKHLILLDVIKLTITDEGHKLFSFPIMQCAVPSS